MTQIEQAIATEQDIIDSYGGEDSFDYDDFGNDYDEPTTTTIPTMTMTTPTPTTPTTRSV